MAGSTAIQCLSDDGHSRGNNRDPELFSGALHQDLVHARCGRELKNAVRRTTYVLFGSGYSDEGFGLVVVGRDVVIADRPVRPDTIASVWLEVVIGEPKADAAVVVSSAAEDARTEPAELTAGSNCVRFAFNVPVPVRRAEE